MMAHDDQINIQVSSEEWNLVQWVTNREVPGRMNSLRCESLQAFVEHTLVPDCSPTDRTRDYTVGSSNR